MSDNNRSLKSGIRDNLLRGTVHDFLEHEIQSGSVLSFVSAYFTIYAYEKMQHPLNEIEELRFLFGDPNFIKRMDPNNKDRKAFEITDGDKELRNRFADYAFPTLTYMYMLMVFPNPNTILYL